MSFFSSRRQTDSEDQTDKKRDSQLLMPSKPVGFETVLGSDSEMSGKLICKAGNVRLDGHFVGTLEISGNILVGEKARIEANIDAHNISIAGEVRGNVTGNKVQILQTGRVLGDIRASSLTTDEGAFIDGTVAMHAPSSPIQQPKTDLTTPNPDETQAAQAVVETYLDDIQATVEADIVSGIDDNLNTEQNKDILDDN